MSAVRRGDAAPPILPLLPELTAMLQQVTGERADWADRITPAARLEDDLLLESTELTALGALLQERYGAAADLGAFLAAQDLDQLIALTVADLLTWLAQLGVTPAAESTR